ncbi:MAG: class I adenylate-forming enzyme family protein [Pseudomonadota bacterium]
MLKSTDPLNRAHHMMDWHLAARESDIALVDTDGTAVSYAQWRDDIGATTEALRESGVRAGDRVLLVGENCWAFVSLAIACWHLEAWFVPVNARMSKPEIAGFVDHANPRLIVATSNVSSSASDHLDHISVVLGKPVTEGFTRRGLKAIATGIDDAEEVFDSAEEQVALMLYTTGTTGKPKGVMLTHRNLLFAAERSRNARALNPADRLYCVLPMTHIFGFASAFMGSLCAGCRLELSNRFDAETAFNAITGGVTVFPGVPAMHAHLMEYAEKSGRGLGQATDLRYISSGGAPLDPEWKRKVETFFGLSLHNGYGMTETTAGIASTSVGAERSDMSCGMPLDRVDIQIVTAPGKDQLEDGVGEIILAGGNIMKGYFRDPVETAKVMDEQGYFHTGDLGHFGEDGCLFIDGRCKEMIIRSGFNVYPLEVETVINTHPDVIQSAVVGHTIEGGNEDVLAFVETATPEQLTEELLRDYLSERLTAYKRPSRIVVSNRLPASSTGKLLKHQMIGAFQEELGL